MTKKILTCLDTLLDTRLGTLATLNPKAAEHVVKTPDYWLREHNNWSVLTGGLVTNEQFNERYAKRDITVLQNSIMTGINVVLLKILAEIDVNDSSGITRTDVGLEVNLAPYELTHDEIEELEDILRKTYGRELLITFCSIPMEELTPKVLRSRYAAIITYAFHEWIVMHDRALLEERTPTFNFIGPKLFEKDPSKLTVDQKRDEFTCFRLFKLEFMDFDFIDVKHMSMFRPEKPQ